MANKKRITIEENEKFLFKLGTYSVLADKRQFILSFGKKGAERRFFSQFEHLLWYMYNQDLKVQLRGTNIEKLAEKIEKIQNSFYERIIKTCPRIIKTN